MNLNEVVADVITAEGVQPITVGAQVCACVRENLRAFVRAADPDSYAQYRSIKYPEGLGSDTLETRREATRFIFDRARDLLVPHYVPSDIA